MHRTRVADRLELVPCTALDGTELVFFGDAPKIEYLGVIGG